MSTEEKYHIISAYMRGGGIRGLIGPEDDDEELADLSEEERLMVDDEFAKLYSEDRNFREALEGTNMKGLSLRDKYELIIAYSRRPPSSMSSEKVEVHGEYVTYKGKTFKRVQLDGDEDDDEYLLDEAGNIYDTQFRLIGRADDEDDEEYQGHLLKDDSLLAKGRDPESRAAALHRELGDFEDFEDEDNLGLFAALGKPSKSPPEGKTYIDKLNDDDYDDDFDL